MQSAAFGFGCAAVSLRSRPFLVACEGVPLVVLGRWGGGGPICRVCGLWLAAGVAAGDDEVAAAVGFGAGAGDGVVVGFVVVLAATGLEDDA